jgi:hypothetical protein
MQTLVYDNMVQQSYTLHSFQAGVTFVKMALSRILHFEAQISKAHSKTRRARDSR